MITFKLFHVMTGFVIRTIDLDNWTFTELSQGPGTLTANVRADKRLHPLLTPDVYGIAVIDDGDCVWCGIIRDRPWKRRQKTIQIGCEDMSSIFYDLLVRPAQGDYLVVTTTKQQVTIFKDQIDRALADPALPVFGQDIAKPDGIQREATFRIFSNVGENLNKLAQRENSLDWWVTGDLDEDGRRLIYTVHVGSRGFMDYPIRAISNDRGGNITEYEWPESSSGKRNREYATGDGEPPDVPWAMDQDPLLSSGSVLLREGTTSWSGVTVADSLFGHARDQRLYYSTINETAIITLKADRPDYRTYTVGDRVAIDIDDEWMEVELPGAAITAREISGGRGNPHVVKLTVATSDYIDTAAIYEAPEAPVDEGD